MALGSLVLLALLVLPVAVLLRTRSRLALAAVVMELLAVGLLYLARSSGAWFAAAPILLLGLMAVGCALTALFLPARRARSIPFTELATLGSASQKAAELAAGGDAPAGYSQLAAGLERARQELHAGKPWGRELVGRWQETMSHFAQEYPLRPTGELIPANPPAGTGSEVTPRTE
jgi:hypothetical protein